MWRFAALLTENMRLLSASFLLGLSPTTSFGQDWVSVCVSNNSVIVRTERQARPLVVGVHGDILADSAYDCAGDVCSSPGADNTTRFMQFFPSGSGRVGDYRSMTSTVTINGNQLKSSRDLSCTVSRVQY